MQLNLPPRLIVTLEYRMQSVDLELGLGAEVTTFLPNIYVPTAVHF